MTALARPPRLTGLVDVACLRACWRLGRQPMRYAGADSAFTFLGAMALVIALGFAISRVTIPVGFELSVFVLLACLAPAVIRRSRALGPGLALLGIGTALALGAAAMASASPLGGRIPDLPFAWQAVAVAFSRETQLGLLVLALAPARRQTGRRRVVRIGLLLAVAAAALGWAAVALL